MDQYEKICEYTWSEEAADAVGYANISRFLP